MTAVAAAARSASSASRSSVSTSTSTSSTITTTTAGPATPPPPPALTAPAHLLQQGSSYSRLPEPELGTNSSPGSTSSSAGQYALAVTFADLSSDLLQLRPFEVNAAAPASTVAAKLAAAGKTAAPTTTTTTTTSALQSAQQSTANTTTTTANALSASSVSATLPSIHHHPPRKPSPGLAARLKALGFGNSSSPSSSSPTSTTSSHKKSAPLLSPSLLPSQPPPPASSSAHSHDGPRVGRLDESRIHQLEEQSATATTTNAAVERRGRSWKGATAAARALLTSSSSSSARASAPEPVTPTAATAAAAGRDADGTGDATSRPASIVLPEITASAPLDMDTNKYRLPDHTNTNGTKVQLETRREHIERAMRPFSPDDATPPPPPLRKDTPPPPANQGEFVPDLASYFTPGHHRPGSIYTLSRASFANQLAQLTSLQLPDAESLSSRVSAIPTAQAATSALINAADQIRSWISKASEVIGGLDSDDDVEWAAAGGREGLAEVESAIARFKELVDAYVNAIDECQRRPDIPDVRSEDLTRAVSQMESITEEWRKIHQCLHNVKEQVEIAMEWEELWNMVLGDIQNEMDELSRLVFEMEERRHKSLMAAVGGDGLDMNDLETVAEETPPHQMRLHAQNRFSIPVFPLSPGSPSVPTMTQDDGSLLALSARLQPMRASLDFLPMRLSAFEMRAERCFPTACEELEMRRAALDASYKKLEKDAESLRNELGEDRWVLVFRNVGRQAQKMVESVEKAIIKVREAAEAGMHLTSPPMMSKRIENFEGKKTHYGPAIDRILMIMGKGVGDRLTVNGEIVRVNAEMQAKWQALKEQMRETDVMLEELQADKKSQQLRDSISSMLSNDRSTIGSGHETPGSSPPSSVIMTSLGFDPSTPTAKPGQRRTAASALPQPSNRRHSSMPLPVSGSSTLPKKPTASRLSMLSRHVSDATPLATTPATASRIQRPSSTLGMRPRWNTSTNANLVDTGHNFKPLSATTPSQYTRRTPATLRSVSSNLSTPTSSTPGSKLPTLRSPISRAASESPSLPDDTPSKRLSFRDRIAAASPGPYAQQTLAQGSVAAKPRLASQASMSAIGTGNRRASMQPPVRSLEGSKASAAATSAAAVAEEDTTPRPTRPASSLASSRRTSMLPQPRTRREGSVTGRESPQAVAGARAAAMRAGSSFGDRKPEPRDLKPRWRG